MATTESSVLMNLKDIFTMEADRLADEAVAKERAKAAEAARLEVERRAQEAALEAAREDERRRADAERIQRDVELEARLRLLRDELADVRTQREEMRTKVAERMTTEPARTSRGSWIAGVMAAASLVAAISATAVAWPRDGEPTPVLTPVAVAEPVEPTIVQPVAHEPIVVATPEPAPEPVVHRPQHHRQPHEPHHTLTDQLNFDDDDEDVLGHLADEDR